MLSCPARDDPHTAWPPLCPNIGAAGFFLAVYILTMIAHIVQAILYRKLYSGVIIMSGIWQVLAYSFRIASIKKVESIGLYTGWFVLILLAPLWTNAYVYMAFGRMVYNFTADAKILNMQAWRFGLYFVLLDILAFIIQAAGASSASGDGLTNAQIMTGLHIYMGGIGIQLFFLLIFLAMTFKARQKMIAENPHEAKSRAMLLLNTLYAVLVLIAIRIIFRLVEYAKGYNTGIPVHEAYQYIFDSLPMFVALALLNVVHPGRIMPGKESDLPSRRARKAAGKGNTPGRAPGGTQLPVYEPAARSSPDMYNGRKPELAPGMTDSSH